MTLTMFAVAAATGAAAAYLVGRFRPGDRLVDWADEQLTQRPGRSPRFWFAVPIALVAVAALWAVHPRRTLATYRDNKARMRRHRAPVPAPQYDPAWASHRGSQQEARPEEPHAPARPRR
ncbi:hypothetical protein ACQPXT_13660 [Streptomyces sp. CA-100214]